MVFAMGALGTLLPKLGQLVQDEYKLQKGVKKDIEFVSRELDAALRNVGEVPPEQLREQVYKGIVLRHGGHRRLLPGARLGI
jgi:disease resistance protein RPM1